ncbi:CBN-IMA-1 protein [Caenorhabditis brenneri]|uniref:CBN-IMA-1 protein n=1 Tax=Caenorhabditis brenneri TaxID=135651 RepID=G0N8L8_CAEBE|nr:CBN-IMA-1 protein [Caenorhabditis brenneri]
MRRKRREDEVQIRKIHREEQFERNRRATVQRSLSNEEVSELMKTVLDGLHSFQEEHNYQALRKFNNDLDKKLWAIETIAKAQILNKLADVYCNRTIGDTTRQLVSQILLKISVLDSRNFEKSSFDNICIQSLVSNISAFSTNEDVLCDTFQALACFLIRSITYRNLALDNAIVPELIEVSTKTMSVRLQRTLMWLVSLFCEKLDKYSPHVDEVTPLLEIIATGITSSDPMVQTDAASSCAFLADWPPIYEHMSEHKLCSMLVANLSNDKGNARPKVKCGISYIIQATSYFTEEMIDAGLLEVLKGFVNVSYMSQEVCFIISNICVEGEHTIDKLISSGVLREVARVMEAAEYRSRKEAAFVICHCCSSSNRRHLEYVIELGMLVSFTDLLTCMDVSLVAYILDAIHSLLQFGDLHLNSDNSNPVAVKLEEAGCRQKLEFLSESQCFDIHIKAYTILERFYEDEDVMTAEQEITNYQPHSTIDNTIDMIIRNNSSAPYSF